MNTARQADDEEKLDWNGVAGRNWVEAQDLLEKMLKPFQDLIVNAVFERSASQVLDIGCGTGDVAVAIAKMLRAKGHCVGVDISQPMINAATLRAKQEGVSASFIHADAQTHAFSPASFDMITSRFGVMFFEDSVEAFANLRRAAKDKAELRLVVWRSAEENPFMTTAERAAAPLLPNIPPRDPDGPGQFAFADRYKVQDILQKSGWTEIDIKPVDISCTMSEEELVRYLTLLGPVGRVLHEANEQTRAQVMETILAAFAPYREGSEVRFNAACWNISALAQ